MLECDCFRKRDCAASVTCSRHCDAGSWLWYMDDWWFATPAVL
jgi:hypothetical protein